MDGLGTTFGFTGQKLQQCLNAQKPGKHIFLWKKAFWKEECHWRITTNRLYKKLIYASRRATVNSFCMVRVRTTGRHGERVDGEDARLGGKQAVMKAAATINARSFCNLDQVRAFFAGRSPRERPHILRRGEIAMCGR